MSLSTESLLGANMQECNMILTARCTGIHFILESLDLNKADPFGVTKNHDYLLIARDLVEEDKRSLVKFFRKRTPCSCLDYMHAELKRQAKTGLCRHCGRRMEWKALKECSKCEVVQYCSKECQVAHWPEHREACKFWSQESLSRGNESK